MSYGFDIDDPLGVGSWWDTYKGYILFGVGAFAGWTLCSLFSAPTVIVQTPSTRGLNPKRRMRRSR